MRGSDDQPIGFDDLFGGLVSEQGWRAKQEIERRAEAAVCARVVQRLGLACERAVDRVKQVVAKYDICTSGNQDDCDRDSEGGNESDARTHLKSRRSAPSAEPASTGLEGCPAGRTHSRRT